MNRSLDCSMHRGDILTFLSTSNWFTKRRIKINEYIFQRTATCAYISLKKMCLDLEQAQVHKPLHFREQWCGDSGVLCVAFYQ